jgi:DNA polymerase elongation subunit (family B)
MITKKQIPDLFIFDIETVTKYQNYDEMFKHEPKLADFWYKRSLKKYYEKHPDTLDIDNFIYKEYAGLYPEFSKIICISITCIQLDIETNEPTFKTKVIYNSNDEKQLLTEFSNICELFTQKKGQKAILAGHNITAFDIPFICKRTIINDLKLPTLFDISGKKPWEINIIDTLNYWKFNSLDMISLDLLCYVLGIDSSKDGDVSGYNLSDMYYSDDKEKESKIKNYCKADTEAVGEILLKLSEI